MFYCIGHPIQMLSLGTIVTSSKEKCSLSVPLDLEALTWAELHYHYLSTTKETLKRCGQQLRF